MRKEKKGRKKEKSLDIFCGGGFLNVGPLNVLCSGLHSAEQAFPATLERRRKKHTFSRKERERRGGGR